jgi:hypothetical protein
MNLHLIHHQQDQVPHNKYVRHFVIGGSIVETCAVVGLFHVVAVDFHTPAERHAAPIVVVER